jgi:hypothetical protein
MITRGCVATLTCCACALTQTEQVALQQEDEVHTRSECIGMDSELERTLLFAPPEPDNCQTKEAARDCEFCDPVYH